MKTTLDRVLGRVTMYRLVWLVLTALFVVTVVLALLGALSYEPLELVASAAVSVAATVASSWLLARVFRKRAHLESALITGLLIFFLFLPTSEPAGLGVLALIAVLASASKWLLAWRGRHVFNPVAIAAVIIALTGLNAGAWWIASTATWPFVLVGTLLVLYRTRRLEMGAVFVVVAVAIAMVRVVGFGSTPLEAFATVVASYPFVFLAGFMLTEPLTTPPRRWQQITVAVVAAVLSAVPFSIGVVYSSPELALVVANLVAFFFGQRRGVALALVANRSLSPSTREFVFEPARPVRFAPGQFVELTVPHRADARGTRRTFSIASHPSNDGTIALAMRVPEKASSFKRELATLPVGTTLRATTVGGDFLLPRDASVPLLLVAGGIGITPFASQLAEQTAGTGSGSGSGPGSASGSASASGSSRDVVLVYSVGDPADLAYSDVLERAGVRVLVIAPTAPDALPSGWSYVGPSRLTPETLEEHVPDARGRAAFVSGPPDMVNGTARVLRRAGLRRVKTDYFSGY